jgi:hypothetical protein
VEVVEEPEPAAPIEVPEPEPEPEAEEQGAYIADHVDDEILAVAEADLVPFFPGDEPERKEPATDEADEADEEDEEEFEEEEEPTDGLEGFWFRRLVDDAGRRRAGLPPLTPGPRPRPRPAARPSGRPRVRTGAAGAPDAAPRRRRVPAAAAAPLPPRTAPSSPPRLPGQSRAGMTLVATPARPLLRPGADDGDAGEPVLRLPGEATARAVLRPSEDESVVARPGDVTCPVCRTPNNPDRHFCIRCGNPLHADAPAPLDEAPAEAAPRRRWWHRFLRRKAPERPWSDPLTLVDAPIPGEAAKLMAGAKEPWKAKVARVGPVALAVLGILTVLGPMRRPIVRTLESARKVVIPRYEQIYPERAEATSSVPDHGPELAVDNAPNTHWSEGAPTLGTEEILYITFEDAVDLGRIGFYSGAQSKPQDFLSQPRPHEVVITYDGVDPQTIRLADKPAFQSFDVDAQNVRVVALRVSSVYVSPLGGTATSIGEVEFFVKK